MTLVNTAGEQTQQVGSYKEGGHVWLPHNQTAPTWSWQMEWPETCTGAPPVSPFCSGYTQSICYSANTDWHRAIIKPKLKTKCEKKWLLGTLVAVTPLYGWVTRLTVGWGLKIGPWTELKSLQTSDRSAIIWNTTQRANRSTKHKTNWNVQLTFKDSII